ncbi:acyl-CoA dehydrogenase, partial [bacterium]|nr:acyl-CoA dehydrogenase [bacterium]
HHGLTALMIEIGTPGFSVGKHEEKMGIRGALSSALHFENCKVPVENRLGNEGEGFKVALSTLDGGRIGIAAQAVGIAQGAYEAAIAYSKQRTAFGSQISDFQAIQFMLADMATEIEAARLLTYRAAMTKDSGKRFSKEASMAKLYASETAMKHTVKAVQIHGGYGYSKEFPVERAMRDAKITEIYEGTSEIQRLVIAESLLR